MRIKTRSFAGRLTRWILFTFLVMMAITTWLIYSLAKDAMTGEAAELYQSVIDATGEKVEKVLIAVEVAAKNSVDEIEANLGQPEKLQTTLEKVLQTNKHLTACVIGFEPDYYPRQGRWFEPYAARTADSTIVTAQIGSAEHDYLSQDWYATTKELGEGRWSEPYTDDIGTKTMLCTFTQPIRDKKGRIVGVSAPMYRWSG